MREREQGHLTPDDWAWLAQPGNAARVKRPDLVADALAREARAVEAARRALIEAWWTTQTPEQRRQHRAALDWSQGGDVAEQAYARKA